MKRDTAAICVCWSNLMRLEYRGEPSGPSCETLLRFVAIKWESNLALLGNYVATATPIKQHREENRTDLDLNGYQKTDAPYFSCRRFPLPGFSLWDLKHLNRKQENSSSVSGSQTQPSLKLFVIVLQHDYKNMIEISHPRHHPAAARALFTWNILKPNRKTLALYSALWLL